MSAPLRDRERVQRPSRAMARMERLQRLAELRQQVNEAVIAEIDLLVGTAGVSFRAIGKVLGEPAYIVGRDYQLRHAPPPDVA